jgi:hypothetical protein
MARRKKRPWLYDGVTIDTRGSDIAGSIRFARSSDLQLCIVAEI